MDELMMDWLYDELDPSSSARVAEHVSGCARCSAEIGAMRRTRAVFRDLPEVDPPPSLSAILLHEAARRAAGTSPSAAALPAAEPTWWARLRAWFAPLALHPTATAVASLIVVVGVAGALYVRRSAELTSTAADRAVPTSASAPADRPVVESAPAAAPTSPEPPAPSAAPEPAAPGVAGELLDGDRQAELRAAEKERDDEKDLEQKKILARLEKKADTAPRQPGRDKGAASDAKRGPKPAPTAGVRAEDPRPIGRAISSAEGNAGSAAAPPPLETEETVIADADDNGRYAEAPPAEVRTRGVGDGSWLALQERRLAELVKSRRCREAASVANDIRDRDATYYARRIEAPRAVEPCQTDVSQEFRRRSAQRALPARAKRASPPADAQERR